MGLVPTVESAASFVGWDRLKRGYKTLVLIAFWCLAINLLSSPGVPSCFYPSMRCRHRGHPASLVKELVFTFLNGIVEHNQNMKTEGDFSGAQFLQVKRLFSGFNRTAIRHYQSSQSKSSTLSTWCLLLSSTFWGRSSHTPTESLVGLPKTEEVDWRMGERNKHKLGMHAEGEVCPFLLRPILCALVWIHGSVFNVNLSEPFKNTHFSSPWRRGKKAVLPIVVFKLLRVYHKCRYIGPKFIYVCHTLKWHWFWIWYALLLLLLLLLFSPPWDHLYL